MREKEPKMRMILIAQGLVWLLPLRDELSGHLAGLATTADPLCLAPPFDALLRLSSANVSALPPCTDYRSYARSFSAMVRLLSVPHTSSECQPPRVQGISQNLLFLDLGAMMNF